ncbi:6890_t:CDS:1, partial [Dentiscutata heterogama]
LFKEFLEDNVIEEFYLTFYGKIFMETLAKLKDDKWASTLGEKCIGKCLQSNNHLISKISLLSIIFENFNELSENHLAFIASILSYIGFVVPCTNVNPSIISSHISSYGRYCHLSKTSSLDILISNIWVRWISSFKKYIPTSFLNFQDGH